MSNLLLRDGFWFSFADNDRNFYNDNTINTVVMRDVCDNYSYSSGTRLYVYTNSKDDVVTEKIGFLWLRFENRYFDPAPVMIFEFRDDSGDLFKSLDCQIFGQEKNSDIHERAYFIRNKMFELVAKEISNFNVFVTLMWAYSEYCDKKGVEKGRTQFQKELFNLISGNGK